MLSQKPSGLSDISEKDYPEISITSIEVDATSDSNFTLHTCVRPELSRSQSHQAPSTDTVLHNTMDSPGIPRTSSVSATTVASSPAALSGAKSPAAAKSKKWDAVFSYLTFREPSVQAMKQYEKDLKRKNGRQSAMTSGMTMSSTQKLPSTLPKVNSKWTGVPDKATRQRSKGYGPPTSMSQPALRGDPYRDDNESINSRYTGTSSQGPGGSSLWSSSHRDIRTEASSPSAQASTASLTNSVHMHSSGASLGSLTKTDLASALQRPSGGESAHASSVLSQPPRQSGQSARSLKPPSLSETASISTSYTTPLTPPPVPPEFLESATSIFYSNSTYCPKKSDGSFMHDGHGRHEQTTPLVQEQQFANASTPTPSTPRDPLAPHPFRKLRAPRPVQADAEPVQSIHKQSGNGITSASEQPYGTIGRKQRARLSLRPEAMFGKKLDTVEPPQSAPADGRFGFPRRGSTRD